MHELAVGYNKINLTVEVYTIGAGAGGRCRVNAACSVMDGPIERCPTY